MSVASTLARSASIKFVTYLKRVRKEIGNRANDIRSSPKRLGDGAPKNLALLSPFKVQVTFLDLCRSPLAKVDIPVTFM